MSRPYTLSCVVEFEDADTYGIAHHSRLINLLERARVHFFHEAGVPVSGGDFALVLADMNLRFVSPARIMDRLEVQLRVKALKAASLIWDYRILKGEQTVLQAEVRQASVDLATLKPKRFPEAVLAALQPLLIEADTQA